MLLCFNCKIFRMRRLIIINLLFVLMLPSLFAQESATAVDSAQLASDNEYRQEVLSDMDKMLNLWYVRREIVNANSVLSRLSDTVQEVSNMDSLFIMRLKNISTPIPLAYNERVKKWINLYVNLRKRSSSAQLGLAQYYFPWMKEIFDKYGVPEELVYMTIIESSLNPTAVSHAGATGIWQFMYTTGKMYGLEVNTFIDDRRDPVKATDAAARHLKDLYNIFNDWGLAVAAYNCGAGNVRKAIARSGGKTTFWGISPYLPRETQNYFPIYIAAYYMMQYHNAHGITAAQIAIPTDVDTVMVNRELHLEQVSKVLNIDMEELQTLNPQYKRNVIPAYSQPYPLKLRNQDILRYLELQDSVHAYCYDEYFTPLKVYESQFTGKTLDLQSKKKYHTVRSGESLSRIASKYGLSVYELKKMNNLKSNTLRVKQRLLVGYVYVAPKEEPKEAPKPVSPTPPQAAQADSVKISVAPASPPVEPKPKDDIIYIVKRGDTLYGIASKYRKNAKAIATYNGIKNMNDLSVGQKIKIPR